VSRAFPANAVGSRSVASGHNRAVAKTTRQRPGPPLDPDADAKSRRRARWWWWATGLVVVGLLLWVLATGGEQDRGNKITAPRDFCKAAGHFEKVIERQHADGNELTPAEVSKQVVLAQAIVDTAPVKLRADAQTFLAALQRAEAAGKQIQVSASERDAAENVNRKYAQGCGVYRRDSGI
jgi:hypothetical protein